MTIMTHPLLFTSGQDCKQPILLLHSYKWPDQYKFASYGPDSFDWHAAIVHNYGNNANTYGSINSRSRCGSSVADAVDLSKA